MADREGAGDVESAAGAADFASFATGTIVVVGMAMLGSLTVLPALLSKLGPRIDKGRVPLVARAKARAAKVNLWGRIADGVLRHPLRYALVTGGLLVALALPALGMNPAEAGEESLPQDLAVVQTFNHVKEAFPSQNSDAEVVVQAKDVTSAPVTAAIEELMPGAEVHANAIDTLGRGAPLRSSSGVVDVLLILALAVATMLLQIRASRMASRSSSEGLITRSGAVGYR